MGWLVVTKTVADGRVCPWCECGAGARSRVRYSLGGCTRLRAAGSQQLRMHHPESLESNVWKAFAISLPDGVDKKLVFPSGRHALLRAVCVQLLLCACGLWANLTRGIVGVCLA